jgi:hypothetical protein
MYFACHTLEAVILTQTINILFLLAQTATIHLLTILLAVVDCTHFGVISFAVTFPAWTTSHYLNIYHTFISQCMAWTSHVHVMVCFDRQPTSHTTKRLIKFDLTQLCPTIIKPNKERILWDQRVHNVLDACTLIFTPTDSTQTINLLLLLLPPPVLVAVVSWHW